jgi:hypothetical protein
MSSSLFVAIAVAIMAAGLAAMRHREKTQPALVVPVAEWADVAGAQGSLPATPMLLLNSPMQEWWSHNADAWAVQRIIALAMETDAGDFNVSFQWKDGADLVSRTAHCARLSRCCGQARAVTHRPPPHGTRAVATLQRGRDTRGTT